ncbi:hypothetical protein [Microbulbifer agarilyticus]
MIFGNKKKPKGPSWKKSLTITKSFSNFEIIFQIPERGNCPGLNGDEYPKTEFDLYGAEYAPIEMLDSRQHHAISEMPIYAEGWKFFGNPFIDRSQLGHVVFSVRIGHISDLPVNLSLFQRSELLRQFERIQQESDFGGYHEGFPEQEDAFDLTEYRWPNSLISVNAQWIDIAGTEWLYGEIQPLNHLHDSMLWICALTDSNYLLVEGSIQRYCANAGNPFRKEEVTPIDNYRALLEQIMCSMRLRIPSDWAAKREVFLRDENHYPLPQQDLEKLAPAVYTLFRWSGADYFGRNKISDADPRAPREQVAAFVQHRVQPRQLPGCIAIAEAPPIQDVKALNTGWTGAIDQPA